jgi:hypothetical protein
MEPLNPLPGERFRIIRAARERAIAHGMLVAVTV